MSSSVAFLCLAFALLMVTNLEHVQARWESAGQISVYLASDAQTKGIDELMAALRRTSGVESARHVSSDAARAELLEASSTTLLEALPNGAFPASIEVSLEDGIAKERVKTIAQQLRTLSVVESVETYGSWTARVTRFVNAANIVALGLTLIVFFAVVTVVASTTKLTLERRRDEVEVLRTVGATSSYVRSPFLIEGAGQGALGAFGAVVAAAVVFHFLSARFDAELMLLLGIEPRFLPLGIVFAMVAVGAVLGAIAAFLSLRKSFSA
jgi:cell division transport system permease protein